MASHPKVFISYRRADTGATVGRIVDRLAIDRPNCGVFVDFMALEAGALFSEKIEQAIRASDLFFAVVGNNWLDGRRLHAHEDLVRREIECALGNKTLVSPILVDGCPVPSPNDLPLSIRSLFELNAIKLDYMRFDVGFQEILRTIDVRQSQLDVRSLRAKAAHLFFEVKKLVEAYVSPGSTIHMKVSGSLFLAGRSPWFDSTLKQKLIRDFSLPQGEEPIIGINTGINSDLKRVIFFTENALYFTLDDQSFFDPVERHSVPLDQLTAADLSYDTRGRIVLCGQSAGPDKTVLLGPNSVRIFETIFYGIVGAKNQF